MKLHIGVDADSGLVSTAMRPTAANVADVTEAHRLLHEGFGRRTVDAGYRGAREAPAGAVGGRVAGGLRPTLRRLLQQERGGAGGASEGV